MKVEFTSTLYICKLSPSPSTGDRNDALIPPCPSRTAADDPTLGGGISVAPPGLRGPQIVFFSLSLSVDGKFPGESKISLTTLHTLQRYSPCPFATGGPFFFPSQASKQAKKMFKTSKTSYSKWPNTHKPLGGRKSLLGLCTHHIRTSCPHCACASHMEPPKIRR